MTKEELKERLDASQEKVDKRIEIINKQCKKLNINASDLLSKVDNFNHPFSYKHAIEYFDISTEDADLYLTSKGNYTERYENAYDYNEELCNLFNSIFKLKELQNTRDNWKVKYDIQVNKESVDKIPILVDFLNEWKNKAYNWYIENCEYALKLSNIFHTRTYNWLNSKGFFDMNNQEKRESYKLLKEDFNKYCYQEFEARPSFHTSTVREEDVLKAYNISDLTKDILHITFNYADGKYDYGQLFGYSENDGSFSIRNIDTDLLNKTLDKECQHKYDDLCNRISAIVGTIEDVSNLHIASTGQLNGIVIGSNGTAKVETIGAGGWNIQCWHYRTLVNRLK